MLLHLFFLILHFTITTTIFTTTTPNQFPIHKVLKKKNVESKWCQKHNMLFPSIFSLSHFLKKEYPRLILHVYLKEWWKQFSKSTAYILFRNTIWMYRDYLLHALSDCKIAIIPKL